MTLKKFSTAAFAAMFLALALTAIVPALAAEPEGDPPRDFIKLRATTQGPFWPPSEIGDENGDFILVGQTLSEIFPGVILPLPDQAVIVSRNTTPPLDENGVEDPFNMFGATYEIVRPLDLRPGSADLDMPLYSHSFGPVSGDFGPMPRIPAIGDSDYNLNGLFPVCKELFAVAVQDETYLRPAFPLRQVPVWGFQGDGIAYDSLTGETYVPDDATGQGCPFFGCPGEDKMDNRDEDVIRLGDWLEARGGIAIQLENFDEAQNGYTHARFRFNFQNLIPNSVYTVWGIRNRNAASPVQAPSLPDPLALPNVFITDENGNGDINLLVEHPFADPATDFLGQRVVGVNIVFHSDLQNWGACFGRFGAGVDVHAHMSSFVEGVFDFSELITVPPSN